MRPRPNPFLPKDEAREKHIQYLIDEINAWILNAEDYFDSSFFESLESQWLERGTLSDKQYQALQNIYERWVDV